MSMDNELKMMIESPRIGKWRCCSSNYCCSIRMAEMQDCLLEPILSTRTILIETLKEPLVVTTCSKRRVVAMEVAEAATTMQK